MANNVTAEEREAMFQLWYAGQGVNEVARVCHRSPTTVMKYKRRYKWDERKAKIQHAAEEKVNKHLIRETAQDIKFVRALKQILLKPIIKNQKVKSQTPIADFNTLVRLEQMLLGMPDSRPDIEGLRKMSNEDLLSLIESLENSLGNSPLPRKRQPEQEPEQRR